MKTRIWPEETQALREDGCAVCVNHSIVCTELAHITKRAFDRPRTPGSKTVYVEPESILPLCSMHHAQYDAHELDVLAHLTTEQQVRAVEDYGSITKALERIAPSVSRRINELEPA